MNDSNALKKPSTYIIEIPYHRTNVNEDMEEMGNGLCHLMEKADMLRGEIVEFSEEFDTLYEGLAEMFTLAEELEFRILKMNKNGERYVRKMDSESSFKGKRKPA